MLRLGEELHKCRLARRFSALLNARLNSVLAPCVQTCCPWPWPVRCGSVRSREKWTPTKGQLPLTLRAPQSSGEQWRRAPVRDEQGGRGRRRTRGGRYLRHRPPPGSLTAVGSNSGRSRPDSSQLKVVEAEARGAPVQCLVAVFTGAGCLLADGSDQAAPTAECCACSVRLRIVSCMHWSIEASAIPFLNRNCWFRLLQIGHG